MNQANAQLNRQVICTDCSLGKFCLSQGLSNQDMERLEGIIKHSRPLQRNEYLFLKSQPFQSIYVVKTGSIKTFVTAEDEKEQVLGFHLPGEFIGLDAIENHAFTCSAKVLETTVVCELPFHQLSELSLVIPDLQQQIFRLLSREIAEDARMLTLLSKKSAEERLAFFLVSLSCRFQRRGFSPFRFNLSMSRSEIGNYLGLAIETVSRLLTRFQEEGLLVANRKHIELLRLDLLQQLAGSLIYHGGCSMVPGNP